jgi:serine/threonine protein kinase
MSSQPDLVGKFSSQRSHYRILGLIGQGQFGRVYCALHRQSGRIYGLKDLEHKVFPTNKFLRELAYLVTLRHPNIVTCYAVEYHALGRYLVMDYCEGGTLRDLMDNEGEVSLLQKLKLITDILAGLEHAHKFQIIHCDIKPENILLKVTTTGWEAKISDFGIAQLTAVTGNPNFGKGYTGSPAYMAPERFYGKFSIASDLYAVGILLYELIVGDRPFSGLPGQIQAAHFNQRLILPENFPAPVRPVVIKALEKLPQKRFGTAGKMKEALDKVIEEISTTQNSAIATQNVPTAFFQFTNRSLKQHSVNEISADALAFPVHQLAVYGEKVYLGLDNQLLCRVYANSDLKGNYLHQWDVYLPCPILALHVHEKGCFILTKQAANKSASQPFQYHLYQFSKDQPIHSLAPKPLGCWQVRKLACSFAPNGKWFALAIPRPEKESRGSFQLFKFPRLNPVAIAHNSLFPSQLIAIDNDHGLAVFLAKTSFRQATVFRLFNRRGDLMSAFTLPLLLTSIILNNETHNHLFALELSNLHIGVLIRLRPLKVTRIALKIKPDFILSYPWGYLLADHQGNLNLLDADGFYIGEFSLKEKITAIAPVGEFRCLVATWSGTQGMIKLLDLGSNIREIIDQIYDERD